MLSMICHAAGNMTADGTGTGTHTYQWDAEGRMSTVDWNSNGCGTGSTNATACYTYNALGERVQGVFGGSAYQMTSEWLYDPSGDELSYCDGGYDSGGRCWDASWVRLGGRSIADYWPTNLTAFPHPDNLGSSTMTTVWDGTVATDMRYYPFGQIWQNAGRGMWDVHFAGMQYPETNFGPWLMPTDFRKFHPTLGRWLSPDLLAGDITNPQSFNRYAYVMNNPTSAIDPLGLSNVKIYAPPGPGECADFADPETCFPSPCAIIWDPGCDTIIPPDEAGGGGGGGGGAGGGGTSAGGSGGGGRPSIGGMGNAGFGGLITCTQTSVVINGIPYPAGPWHCSLTLPPWLAALPFAGSVNIPIPVVTAAGVVPGPGGPSIPFAVNVAGANSGCVGGGAWVGTPGAKTVGGGPVIGVGNPKDVLSGWSWSFNYQGPLLGFQVIWNSSGVLAGPSVGLVPGVSVSRTWSKCG